MQVRVRRKIGLASKAVSALVVATLSIVPALAADPGVTDKEVVIGSCCALSGPAKLLGSEQLIGAQAYIKSINEQGGVHGRKIKLNSYDDGYEPDKAIVCFNKLVAEGNFAGAFFVGTPTAAKYVPMAEQKAVPIVGLFTGASLLHEPFRQHVISVRASYLDETKEQIDHMWKDLGYRKIGVIYQSDAFGAAVLEGVKRALAKFGSAPVVTGSFTRNTVDVYPAVNQVKAGNPQAVVLVGAYGPLAEIVKYSHAQGFSPLFTTVSFVGTEAFINAAGKDADGTVITQVVPPYNRDDLPTVAEYKKLLKKYFPKEKPSFVSFEGFVDAMILVEGLKRAGRDLTRSNFIKSIESIHNMDMGLGSTLKANYGPDDHKGFDSLYFTVVRNGEPVAFTNWKDFK